MPEGIGPELLIALFFLVVIVAAILVARSGTRSHPPEATPARTEEPPSEIAAPVDEAEPAGAVAIAETAVPEVVDEPPVAEIEELAPPRVVEEPRLEAAEAAPVTPRPSLRERLAKSRGFLSSRIAEVFRGGPPEDIWEDLEAVLVQADVGVESAMQITEDLKSKARGGRVTDPAAVKELLSEELVSLFGLDRDRALQFAPEGVTVWLLVGVNGTGKTTTIGKLARDLGDRGKTVALAAADTFRAAADEQLTVWAQRAGAHVVKHQPGADPGAVAFDAVQHVRARGIDVLIVDTAGRLHTKIPLMDELSKVRRVIEKEVPVTETLLVIDATSGQNGLVQAREFARATGVTGVVLTKLDGTAKGGIALAIEKTLDIPIKVIGVGEGIDDLEPFDPPSFVDALIS